MEARDLDDAVDVSERLIELADEGAGALIAVNIVTGDRTPITDVLIGPTSVAPEFDTAGFTGRVLVVDADALIAIDIETGARTELSGPSVGDGAAIETPLSLVFELALIPLDPDADLDADPEADPLPRYAPTGFVLVVHEGPVSLLAIELSTGRRTELTGVETAGPGPLLDVPQMIVHDPDNERITLADSGNNGVLMIDQRNNQRVLVSR